MRNAIRSARSTVIYLPPPTVEDGIPGPCLWRNPSHLPCPLGGASVPYAHISGVREGDATLNVDDVISRRELLRRGGLAAGALSLGGLLAACGSEPPAEPAGETGGSSPTPQSIEGAKIKVSTYGGFFEENFAKMYPAFTKETGVEVESIAEPTSEAWVVQLQQAIDAGAPPPADVSMLSGVGIQRAINGDILVTYDQASIPQAENLAEGYVRTDPSGLVAGVGAVSVHHIVSNTDRVSESRTVDRVLDPQWENELRCCRCRELVPDRDHGRLLLRRLRHPAQDGASNALAPGRPERLGCGSGRAQAQQAYNTGRSRSAFATTSRRTRLQGEPPECVPTEGAIPTGLAI
jgi:hypothetical protein